MWPDEEQAALDAQYAKEQREMDALPNHEYDWAMWHVLHQQGKVARGAWADKNEFVFKPDSNDARVFHQGKNTAYIYAHTSNGKFEPWTAPQPEMVANDWYLVG